MSINNHINLTMITLNAWNLSLQQSKRANSSSDTIPTIRPNKNRRTYRYQKIWKSLTAESLSKIKLKKLQKLNWSSSLPETLNSSFNPQKMEATHFMHNTTGLCWTPFLRLFWLPLTPLLAMKFLLIHSPADALRICALHHYYIKRQALKFEATKFLLRV